MRNHNVFSTSYCPSYVWMASRNQCFPDTTGKIHMNALYCGSVQKTYTNSSLMPCQFGEGEVDTKS